MKHRKVLPVKPNLEYLQSEAWVIYEREREKDRETYRDRARERQRQTQRDPQKDTALTKQ